MSDSIIRKENLRYLRFIFLLLMMLGTAAAHADNRPTRVLNIKIVADRQFAAQEVWKRKASRQIEAVEEDLRGLLDVNIDIVGYEIWSHDTEADLYALASQLVHEISPDSADAVIGFTYVPCPPEDVGPHTDGVTVPFRGMMIRNYHPPCRRNRITRYAIIHEMIHLFGGVHVGRGNLMSPVLEGQVMLDLDPLNRRIVRLTRDIDFVRGYNSLDPEDLRDLADLYLIAIERGNRDMIVLFNLGEIYAALRDYESATSAYKILLAIDSSSTRAWLGLADAYTHRGRDDSAMAVMKRSLDYNVDSGIVLYRMAHMYYDAEEYGRAYDCAARAAWKGVEIDSGFRRWMEEFRNDGPSDSSTILKRK